MTSYPSTSALIAISLLLPAQAGTDPPLVAVTTVEGRRIDGRMETWRLGEPLRLSSDDGRLEVLPSADLDRLACRAQQHEQPRGPWRVEMRDGSTLFVELVGGDERHLTAAHPQFGILRLPLLDVGRVSRVGAKRPAVTGAGDEDQAALASGDVIRGTLEAATEDGFMFVDAETERFLAWKSLSDLVLAGDERSSPKGLAARVHLADGTTIRTGNLRWEAEGVNLSLFDESSVSVPFSALADVEVEGGRRVWLSDVPVAAYQSIPYFTTGWPIRVDTSVLGDALTVGGVRFRHGIGLHSACRASWKLDGAYDRFRTFAGIDDSAGKSADAELTLELDGKELARLEHLVAGQPPRRIDVSVAGGKELTIIVGFGERGPVQDRVNIVDAALIRR